MMKKSLNKTIRLLLLLFVAGMLSGCAFVMVDAEGNRTHSGLMWVRQQTVNNGQTEVTAIKLLGVELAVCPTGMGLMAGYKQRLLAWPSHSSAAGEKDQHMPEHESTGRQIEGGLRFMSLSVPANHAVMLYGSSQLGASLSTCPDYPVIGVGYRSRTRIQYDYDGKAYSLQYVAGRPEEILFQEIDPETGL